MAIFRGTTGTGSSDNTIVSAVTEQAGIATTKADEAEGFRDEAEGFKNTASTSATTATNKASEASDSADTASDKATEANTAKTAAEDAQEAAEAARDTAQTHANTANNSSVQTVAGISTEVQNLDNIKTDITSVNTIKSDVTTVAGISSNVTTVAADASDIGTVATNIANVNNVGNNISNVNAVHSNASNINTVAADGTDIGTVASNISNVNTVAGISSDVTTVAGLESKMDTVIADASDIGAVAGNIGDVTTVAGINSEVDTVAGISAKVTTVADNITDVQNADTNAANASASASQAANSATAASNSATTASTKATEASNSATAASNSATTATTKATEAAGSATTATTKATEASTSATNAATSATTATTKASEAASSATAASGSATTATTKASEADASATSAASSATDATNASNTWNNFYTTYLGAADAPPTVDVQGNALQTGAFYYDTGAGSNTVGLYVYNGSSWVYSTNYNNVTAPYSLSQDLATNGNDISFGDNAKATFGASDDLQIYHNGSDSYIRDVGTGNLNIDATNFNLRTGGGNEIYLSATTNGAVGLRYDNAEKLATTSTGIDVTGIAKISGTEDEQLVLNSTDNGPVYMAFKRSNDRHAYLGFGGSSDHFNIINEESSGVLTLGTNGSERMRITSDGKVGIGTSNPSTNLEVSGSAKITGNGQSLTVDQVSGSGGAGVILKSTGTNLPFVRWTDGTTNIAGMRADDSGKFYIQTNGFNNRLTIDSTGNVGIGTTSPNYPLDVAGDIRIESTNPKLHFTDTDGSPDWNIFAASGSFRITQNDSDEKLRIDSSGNVGIGTSSPSEALEVNGKGLFNNTLITNTAIALKLKQASGTENDATELRTGGGEFKIYSGRDSGNHQDFVFATGDNYTSGTERMRIDSSGNVGIGTTSPAEKLSIQDGDIIVQNDTKATFGFRGTSASTALAFRDRFAGVDRLTIDSSGNVGIGGAPAAVTHGPHLDLVGNRGTLTVGTGYFEDNGTTNFIGGARSLAFGAFGSGERMRIDSSGNVLVGTTDNNVSNNSGIANSGINLLATGQIFAAYGGNVGNFNRLGSDGSILNFDKDGTTVGAIGTRAAFLNIGSGDTGLLFNSTSDRIQPESTTGGARDAAIDIGGSSTRFKDIYRSGSTYSTSDRNKKQDIRDLTDAEARVAVVAKGSLKAFRYIDSVEAEGDDANIHFGIIAQDLKAAFEAEGLNADSYQVLKTSTYTDDDGVEQTTYSVCYENLLAFIISAI